MILCFSSNEEMKSIKDAVSYQVIFEAGIPHELRFVDHWFSAGTYEKLFKQVGFKSLWNELLLKRLEIKTV